MFFSFLGESKVKEFHMLTSPVMNATVAPRSWTKSVYGLKIRGKWGALWIFSMGNHVPCFTCIPLIWGMLPKKMYFLIFPILYIVCKECGGLYFWDTPTYIIFILDRDDCCRQCHICIASICALHNFHRQANLFLVIWLNWTNNCSITMAILHIVVEAPICSNH